MRVPVDALDGAQAVIEQLRADLAAARAEVDETCTALRQTQEWLDRATFNAKAMAHAADTHKKEEVFWRDRAKALEADNARLRAALRKYGEHTWPCDRWVRAPETDSGFDIDDTKPCTCGLDAALAEESKP